jgi:hypothetical protein
MSLHRGFARFLPTLNGNVMKEGGSFDLAKGQLGVFDARSSQRNGLKAISNFSGLSKDTRLQVKVGVNELDITRTQANFDKGTRTFKLSEITGLEVFAPSTNKKVDDFIVGYNGNEDSSALDFSDLEVGEVETMQIELSGGTISLIGYSGDCVTAEVFFEKESATQTNQEIVEKAIINLKEEYKLISDISLNEVLEVTPVNSESASLSGQTEHTFYNLSLVDVGDSNSLAQVQAQFGTKVERSDRKGTVSTYTILIPTIASAGLPDAFVKTVGSVIKGCADCPTGFTADTGGVIYYVSLEDDGADESVQLTPDSGASVVGLPGVITGSVVKQGQDGGKGVYAVATDNDLTDAEIDAFVADNPTAEISKIGETKDICSNDSETTEAWTAGSTANALTEAYTLILPDNKCGENILAEVRETYPDLTITAASSVACQTVYSTSVVTSIVEEECDPIFRDLFISESPSAFGFTEWTEVDKVYSATAKMGIRLRGKETIVNPGEFLRDGVPFIDTSTRISVVGGYRANVFYSLMEGSGDRFSVKVLSRAEDLSNLGGHLYALEDRDHNYFTGVQRHRHADGHQNELVKALRGEESVLIADAQYVTYKLKVSPESSSQSMGQRIQEHFVYMVSAEVGKHKDAEELLNSLVATVGLPTVKAYGA